MAVYDHKTIESKWRTKWEEQKLVSRRLDEEKPKYYCLEMFPYPSGRLHIGHVRNYTIGDVVARFKRMTGSNVLHPMGWDAFGLPAENAAIENKIPPASWTWENIEHMREQMRRLGFSYDWSTEIATCAPEYYRWTQWIFLKLHERGIGVQERGRGQLVPAVPNGACQRASRPRGLRAM